MSIYVYIHVDGEQDSREALEDAVRAVPEGINALPSFIQEQLFALVVCGEVSPGLS